MESICLLSHLETVTQDERSNKYVGLAKGFQWHCARTSSGITYFWIALPAMFQGMAMTGSEQETYSGEKYPFLLLW